MHFDVNNKPSGLRRIYLASLNSFRGLKWLVQNESAFRQEAMALCITILLCWLIALPLWHKVALVLSVVLVILVEIINTAIEATVDRVGYDLHPLSGLAKDLGSAAVFIAMLIAVIVWCAVGYSYWQVR